jgi:hypothetical protein
MVTQPGPARQAAARASPFCDSAAPTGSHSAGRPTRDTQPRSSGRRERALRRVGQAGARAECPQSTGHRLPQGRHRQAGWCGRRSFRGSVQACYEGRLSLVTPRRQGPSHARLHDKECRFTRSALIAVGVVIHSWPCLRRISRGPAAQADHAQLIGSGAIRSDRNPIFAGPAVCLVRGAQFCSRCAGPTSRPLVPGRPTPHLVASS